MANPKKPFLIIFLFAWGKCFFPNIPFASTPKADLVQHPHISASDCSIFDDFGSSSFEDSTFETQALRSNNQESYSIDLLEVPLMPYYFAANSQLPYGPSKNSENWSLLKIILQAIKKNFNINPKMRVEELHPIIFDENTSNKSAESLKLGFLGRLCVRNITFLLHIHKMPDAAIQEEVDKTLQWLFEQLKNYPNSKISTAVSEHLETSFKPIPMLTIKGKRDNIKISEFKAIDTKIIIFILDTYYRTSNTTKWNHIFNSKYSFLNFCVGNGINSINYENLSALRTHWSKFQNEDFLPWSNDISLKDNMSVFFMHDWNKINIVMHRRAPQDSKEWKDWESWFIEKLLVQQ